MTTQGKPLQGVWMQVLILKQGNSDKFESRFSDIVFLSYASHSHAYRVLNLETYQVVETYEVTFDETVPCSTLVFHCAGD
jgi:hypothetical protein